MYSSLSSDIRGARGGWAYILSDAQFGSINPVTFNILNYHDHRYTNRTMQLQSHRLTGAVYGSNRNTDSFGLTVINTVSAKQVVIPRI